MRNNKHLKVAKFLIELSDLSPIWDDYRGYTKQYVFKDYSYSEIQEGGHHLLNGIIIKKGTGGGVVFVYLTLVNGNQLKLKKF